jgi:RNA polymerase sigma-70 factor (ECF subfamily)
MFHTSMWALGAVVSGTRKQDSGGEDADDARVDQDAVRRMAGRDPDALAQLYDRYSRLVYSFALHIVGDQAEAEDVVQEVFSQAWAQAPRYAADRGAVAAWLLTITRSRAIDCVRARRARPDSEPADESQLQGLVDPAAPHDVGVLTREQIGRLRDAMANLPPLQRVVVEMAYFEGLTQSEIAARLEEPLGTVKTRARLALLKLRQAMTGSTV